MQTYGVNELRKMFLDFFESKEHLVHKSFSLVPHNDKSLLLINSGMAPLKPYFTGQEIPPRRRMATCQKCIRTGDIENVGKTARHGTFFEMLGNFSFGDYFKREAIHWSWEFLTEVVGLDPNRLYPSVYVDDQEAFDIWNKEMGIPADRIYKFGKEDNFWEHGSGPCGPCSEIYYDRGEKYGCGKPDCTVGCECDRYMEIWNNVFTQFDNDGHGNYSELEQKNIDTGMGLERLASVVQDVDSIFDIDTMKALRDEGLIVTHRGKNGGYSLGRPPERIRLYDVVALVEGTVALNRCLEEDGYCGRDTAGSCTVYKCYSVMQKKWENFFKGVTIDSLLTELSEEEIEKRIENGPVHLVKEKFRDPIFNRKAVGVV